MFYRLNALTHIITALDISLILWVLIKWKIKCICRFEKPTNPQQGGWCSECTSRGGGLPCCAAKIRITLIFKCSNCSGLTWWHWCKNILTQITTNRLAGKQGNQSSHKVQKGHNLWCPADICISLWVVTVKTNGRAARRWCTEWLQLWCREWPLNWKRSRYPK